MEVELRHLRSFVVVAEERHFGRAAKRLGIAQPPLSHRIRQLEDELGVTLFDRTSRPIRLTPAGTAVLGDAKATLDQARQTVERARSARSDKQHRLLIGAFPWAFNAVLPGALRAFAVHLPSVEVRFSILAPDKQAEALRERRLDIGFAGLARWLQEDRTLDAEPLIEEPLVAIVPRDHPLAGRSEVSLEELAAEVLVSPLSLLELQSALFEERGLRPANVQEVPDALGQLGLISAGLGVGLHWTSFSTLRRRGVAFVPLAGDVPSATLVLLSRRGDDRETTRLFRDSAREAARSPALAG